VLWQPPDYVVEGSAIVAAVIERLGIAIYDDIGLALNGATGDIDSVGYRRRVECALVAEEA
jgi:hypothetical protein